MGRVATTELADHGGQSRICRTPLANSPDWLKAAPMRENLLASRRQSGRKQDPCPSLLNYNAKYKRLLPPFVISPTVSVRFWYNRPTVPLATNLCGNVCNEILSHNQRITY